MVIRSGLVSYRFILLSVVSLFFVSCKPGEDVITVGSKRFPESYILAELIAQVAESTGEAKVIRKFGMGGTIVLYTAMKQGSIDIYPEYTGTIVNLILGDDGNMTVGEINKAFSGQGVEVSGSLGFNNSYALAMKSEAARSKGIEQISDLEGHNGLTSAFSHEFMNRKDGLPGLLETYDLDFGSVRGIDHTLAYVALDNDEIDMIDVYTTDGKLRRYDLYLLKDDREFFPKYFGVFIHRNDFRRRFPQTYTKLNNLVGKLDQETMIRLNSYAELKGVGYDRIVSDFLSGKETSVGESEESAFSVIRRFVLRTIEDAPVIGLAHVRLVSISLAISIIIALPLGILAYYYSKAGQVVLIFAGILQTIPSLALYCFLIPFFGIGVYNAIIALFLYSLLPIVRNTYSGLSDIDPSLDESARALGLSPLSRLYIIQLPLASRSIMSGIKTSAIINVGIATLASLIGAGGYGDPIISGLSTLDTEMIMRGAIPASLLAMFMHVLFELIDLLLIPKGLRIK